MPLKSLQKGAKVPKKKLAKRGNLKILFDYGRNYQSNCIKA